MCDSPSSDLVFGFLCRDPVWGGVGQVMVLPGGGTEGDDLGLVLYTVPTVLRGDLIRPACQ